MKYEDFEKFVREKCMYDTIYDDSNGRQVLIIQMLDAYGMVNKAQREWVGLTEDEILADDVLRYHFGMNGGAGPVSKKGKTIIEAIEAKLKEKNG